MVGSRRAKVRAIASASLVAALVAGCAGGSLEFGTPVNLHVWTTSTTVEVDAPDWITDASRIYLCPTDPPRLPDGAAERVGWTPGDACQDFGTFQGPDGLRASLPLTGLEAERVAAFDAAGDWYLLILDLDGERVGSAVRSRFHAPRADPA